MGLRLSLLRQTKTCTRCRTAKGREFSVISRRRLPRAYSGPEHPQKIVLFVLTR